MFQVELMDESILLSAKTIIMNKLSSGQPESGEVASRIKTLEEMVQTLGQKLDLLLQKVA